MRLAISLDRARRRRGLDRLRQMLRAVILQRTRRGLLGRPRSSHSDGDR